MQWGGHTRRLVLFGWVQGQRDALGAALKEDGASSVVLEALGRHRYVVGSALVHQYAQIWGPLRATSGAMIGKDAHKPGTAELC